MKNFITIQRGENSEKINKNHLYEKLFGHFPDALFLLDQEGYFIDVNKGLEELTGVPQDQLIYSHFSTYVHEDDLPLVKEYFQGALKGEVQNRDFRVVKHDGSIRYVSVTVGAAMHDATLIGAFGTAKDRTEKKELERIIENTNARFESLIQHSADVIAVLDGNGIITYESPSISNVLGYEADQVIGTSCFDYMVDEDAMIAKSLMMKVLHSPNETIIHDFQMKAIDGRVVHCEAYITNLLNDKNVNGVVVNYRDITERKKYEQDIMHRAYHDYLTGLPNRYKLESVLQAEIEKNEKLTVLFLDLDRFKIVNDSMGHQIGDLLLQEVSKRLKAVIGEDGHLFRHSGDEFIMIIPEADYNMAEATARSIKDAMAKPFFVSHYEIFCSMSIGISLYPEDGQTGNELIKHADYAMYQAKKSGNKEIHFFSTSELNENVNPLKMEIELHKALERKELTLYYQPKINLKTGKVTGFEALVRWLHPEWGMVSPGTFIPIAEDSGLIIPIGEWVLYEACSQNVRWHEQGLETTVSVNLSPRQFSQTNLVKMVKDVLKDTGLPAKCLELEVTESMTADLDRAIETLQELKKIGVRISIDDFGTGFSSLNYLKRFPVDTLKIDQSFVKELYHHPNDETIVKMIISMAHHLNLTVVAEGIETQEQLVFLQQHLCDEGQGFLFCRPLPPEQLQVEIAEIQKTVGKDGISQELNERMWAEELVHAARRDLQETIRLQQGLTLKYKKVGGRFVHTFCEGELLYKFGMNPSQIIGKDLFDILTKEEAARKHTYYERAWEGEDNVSYEGSINGVPYMARLGAVKKGGMIEEVICSCIDMTEQKRVEKALGDSEQKYRLIAENMSDLISIIDAEGNLLYASPSHEAVLGYKEGRYSENLNVLQYIHPEDEAVVIQTLKYMINNKKPLEIEFRYKHVNGEWMFLETSATPILGKDGEVEQIIAVGRDMTEKKRAEKLLWNTEKLALVGEFAAGVAHEIRTPLTTIKGFIQLFEQGELNDEYFTFIYEEFERMEEIVSEFLTLAKQKPVQLQQTAPGKLIEEVLNFMSAVARLKNVRLSSTIDKEIGPIHCDINLMKQVLIHLLRNSIEATPDGGVIDVFAKETKGYVIFRVEDNGIGISKERIKKLGEPFYSNTEKGTGLGLMLCFRVIQQHNGSIKIESEENQGTTVEVILPKRPFTLSENG
ncbi:EAL domain-containing protein [Bacillus sp. KH172YL63]|uniref:EAL domain-containing protein n=1 Tax=Bacillus sp. KH172YL63 TaxID=2709784 RepID=UPI0013E5208A|nr:EAL domain-containing protein [Bacillus sp. KH172YL63]BCB05721.1 hypothetical protein KH172YL63_38540 [Bacillus sp. KH172YL63]